MDKLSKLKAKAKKEKWLNWIQSKNDEEAILEGCYFSQESADHVCNFIEQYLKHAKGFYAGKPIELQQWQRDLLSKLFGWKRPDESRRYKFSGVWMAKKNGKSFLASAIGLYMLLAEGRVGAEIISLANSREQACHVFDNASQMLKSSPELSALLNNKTIIETPSKQIIAIPSLNSRYKVLSSSHSTSEGYDQSCCIVDELHAARDDKLFQAIRWGGIAQKGSLLLTISTAGVFDPEHIAWRQWVYANEVAKDERIDTSFLPIIYAADPDDDFSDEKVWLKANPMLGATLDLKEFKQNYEQVKDSVTDFNDFLRYRLNIWTQSIHSWIPDAKYQEAVEDFELTEEELAERKWYGGLDLSSTKDITALVLMSDKGEIEPHYWVCEGQVTERQKREDNLYAAWTRAGKLHLISGDAIDYDFIFEEIIKLRETHNIQTIALDRWAAPQIVQRLEGENFDIYYHGQGYRDMSNPTKELERLILNKNIKLPSCPVLRWMMRNVVIETDPAGNVKCSKTKSKDKIDGIIALIMALSLKLHSEQSRSIYETQGITII